MPIPGISPTSTDVLPGIVKSTSTLLALAITCSGVKTKLTGYCTLIGNAARRDHQEQPSSAES